MSNCIEAKEAIIAAGAIPVLTTLLTHEVKAIASGAAGAIMALSASIKGKQASIDSPKTIPTLCDIVRRTSDDSPLRTNAAICLRHICEQTEALHLVGARLLRYPSVLGQVLGPAAVSRIIEPYIVEKRDRASVVKVLEALVQDEAGCKAAFDCLNVIPFLFDAAAEDDGCTAVLHQICSNCAPARKYFNSLVQKQPTVPAAVESVFRDLDSLSITSAS
uniref:Armadillo repeat-containing protein 8 n=1 Tax=Spongospora subterranea TaxID=70186 RepID=A0A0H5RAB1_9EUKA|eukprot:CRZ11090.1 hypothetical protein [Spongospora subterranea]